MRSLFLFTVLMVTLTIVSALIFGATFLYSWLWTLLSPLSLWQIAILTVIVFIPMIFRTGDAIVDERPEPYLHLLLGPLFVVGIAMLFGWITTAITGADRWQATLFSVIIVTTLFYTILRIADRAVERFGPVENWDTENEEDDYDLASEEYELGDSDVDRVIWLANKNDKSRKRRRKRR